jgi:hypothetical protein
MARLKKEECVFMRDGEGKLVPQEVELELLEDKPTIMAIPLTKGDLVKYQGLSQSNPTEAISKFKAIISNNCTDPKFTDIEIDDLKLDKLNAIIIAIMSLSVGKSQEEIVAEGKKKGESKTDLATNFLPNSPDLSVKSN